jgi:CDP-diacylglycerol--glycerol-3-phosphate 3-phosphatidyltransferase/cardiolipin synthase
VAPAPLDGNDAQSEKSGMTIAADQRPMPRSKPLSVPNLITYGRIVAVPVVAGFIMLADMAGTSTLWWWAFAVFAAAAISDYFDGMLARWYNEQSELGRMLDPIADKLLVGVVLLVLVGKGVIGGWSLVAAIIILSREILVSGLREYLSGLDVKMHVTNLAKAKTAAQLVALGAMIAGPFAEPPVHGLQTWGLILLWASALLTAYTGYEYLHAALQHATSERTTAKP